MSQVEDRQEDKVKSQVVFDSEPVKASEVLDEIKHLQDKMVFDDTLPMQVETAESKEQALPVALEQAITRSGKKWSLGAKALLAVVVAILGIETAQFFVEAWSNEPFMAGLYSGAFALALLLAGKVTLAEYRQLKQLKKLQQWQSESERMERAEQVGQALKMCDTINKQLPQDMSDALGRWREAIKADHTDKEILLLYSEMVLTQADDKAVKLISRYASETALMVAISPLAVMDMALVLWRSTKMIDQICALYGVKLGYWSRIRLIKAVIHNVIYAGVTELLADVGSAALSLELAGKLSARAAQGLGAGLLTGRLGFKVIQFCRPVPALPNKQKRLGDLSKQLLSDIRRAIGNKSD